VPCSSLYLICLGETVHFFSAPRQPDEASGMSDYDGGGYGPPQGYGGGNNDRGPGGGGFRPPGGGSGMGLLVVALVVLFLFIACQDQQDDAALPAHESGVQQVRLTDAGP
jgi:hypothetical protein